MTPLPAFQSPYGVWHTPFSHNAQKTGLSRRPRSAQTRGPHRAARACVELPGIDNAARMAAKAAAAEAGGDSQAEADLGKFRNDVPLLNTVMLTGRLGADPALRQVGRNNVALCTFSLAVNSQRTYADGTRHTSWFKVNVWGSQAERAASLLRKGLRVGVAGRIGIDQYTDRQGQQRQSVVVTAKSFEVLQSRSEFGGDMAPRPGNDSYAAVQERAKARKAPMSYDGGDNVDPF